MNIQIKIYTAKRKFPTGPLWGVLCLLQAWVIYQRPGILQVLCRILAVPGITFFWTEVSGVILGIWHLQPRVLLLALVSLTPLLPTSFPSPLSALVISRASCVLILYLDISQDLEKLLFLLGADLPVYYAIHLVAGLQVCRTCNVSGASLHHLILFSRPVLVLPCFVPPCFP